MDMDRRADLAWILGIQRQLYQWSKAHPDEGWRDMWGWLTDPRTLRHAWRREPALVAGCALPPGGKTLAEHTVERRAQVPLDEPTRAEGLNLTLSRGFPKVLVLWGSSSAVAARSAAALPLLSLNSRSTSRLLKKSVAFADEA